MLKKCLELLFIAVVIISFLALNIIGSTAVFSSCASIISPDKYDSFRDCFGIWKYVVIALVMICGTAMNILSTIMIVNVYGQFYKKQ